MLQYPWQYPMPAPTATADLRSYVPRVDASGPSMTDAIHAIDAAALGDTAAAYQFLVRSEAPFERGPFDQFAETRQGGAFTFMTGMGGFLQEFLYGFSGLRLEEHDVVVAPTLPPQIPGLTLQNLSWQGRRFSLAIGPQTSTLTLTSGPPMPVNASLVRVGAPLTIPTRRPDLTATADAARCKTASATSTDPSFPAVGAVDGDPTTAWQAQAQAASLQVDLGAPQMIGRVDITWGASNASRFAVAISTDARHWTTVGSQDHLTFPPAAARYVRVAITATPTGRPPAIAELSAGP
jgi:hypothetical protein